MNIHSIETGFFSTDGGAMFGIVPRKIWSAKYLSDDENRCPLAMRVLFADLGERKVLFDTGVGGELGKDAAYYRFHDLKTLHVELSRMGYRAEEVTDVVLSHLHFDHCGGSVARSEDGNLVPAFPGAIYWASRKQRELAENPSLWEADSYAPAIVRTLEKAGQLRLIDEDLELFPGLRVRLASGHTDGQLLSYLETPMGTLVYCGDVIPMRLHLTPLCIAAVDNQAVVSVEEKMRVLEEATEKNQILFFFHDVQTVGVRVKKVNGVISVSEKLLI